MSDRPLHVQVAEVLRWTDLHHIPIEELGEHDHWTGKPPEGWDGDFQPFVVSGIDREERLVVNTATIPRFHDDPRATWPLIVKYGISVQYHGSGPLGWAARSPGAAGRFKMDDDPLRAVAWLIVDLAKVGKLIELKP